MIWFEHCDIVREQRRTVYILFMTWQSRSRRQSDHCAFNAAAKPMSRAGIIAIHWARKSDAQSTYMFYEFLQMFDPRRFECYPFTARDRKTASTTVNLQQHFSIRLDVYGTTVRGYATCKATSKWFANVARAKHCHSNRDVAVLRLRSCRHHFLGHHVSAVCCRRPRTTRLFSSSTTQC
jgi:hypothetical protein